MILNKKGRVGRLNVSLLHESQDSGGGRKEFLVQVEPIVRSRGGEGGGLAISIQLINFIFCRFTSILSVRA